MKLPPFEKFLAEKEQSTLKNILKNVPKGSPKNAQDFVHQATQKWVWIWRLNTLGLIMSGFQSILKINNRLHKQKAFGTPPKALKTGGKNGTNKEQAPPWRIA